MRREVPARARALASELAALFWSDRKIVERLNDAQRRLACANDRLWSGLHPDALGLVDDDAHVVLPGRMIDPLASSGGGEAQAGLLQALRQVHWAVHSAFVDYQSACEDRRRLAVDVGEVGQKLTETLIAAGWSEEAARDADVHELAAAGTR